MQHTFRREELYELVWSSPMSKLAKQLGVSDVGLAKACKRAQIPVPGIGHWARIQYGKPVKGIPLPPAVDGIPHTITIGPGPRRPSPPEIPADVVKEIAHEGAAERKIAVPNKLSNPHRVIKAWIEDEKRRRRSYGPYFQPQPRDPIESRRRRILNALFKALEQRGNEVVVDPERVHQVTLRVNGEGIEFRLTQRQRKVKEALSPEEATNPRNIAQSITERIAQRPTDELVFRITSWVDPGVRTQWGDAHGKPLKTQLNDVVAGLLIAAVSVRRRRLDQEEARYRWRAEEVARWKREEARREEAQRLEHLTEQISRWRRAHDIRAYVKAVKEAVKKGTVSLDDAILDAWSQWALARANQLDPISSGHPIGPKDELIRPTLSTPNLDAEDSSL